jgi:hypothetical protein
LKQYYLLHAGFLLVLFFNPKEGGNMLLLNVGWLSTDNTAFLSQEAELFITTAVNTSKIFIITAVNTSNPKI